MRTNGPSTTTPTSSEPSPTARMPAAFQAVQPAIIATAIHHPARPAPVPPSAGQSCARYAARRVG